MTAGTFLLSRSPGTQLLGFSCEFAFGSFISSSKSRVRLTVVRRLGSSCGTQTQHSGVSVNTASPLRDICETRFGRFRPRHQSKVEDANPVSLPTCHRGATSVTGELANTWSSERTRPMATSTLTPTSIACRDFNTRAFNDNGGQPVSVQPSSRILVALQDAESRRWMSRVLRARGFRVIALDEPSAAWSMVADHASPRLPGFDFVICGSFHSDFEANACRVPGIGTRFFLLLGRCGFVPFAADGRPPPAWAFRRAGSELVQDNSSRAVSMDCPGSSPGAPSGRTQ
jgi:hypothetical protein